MLNRYKLDHLISERQSVSRFRGRDTGPNGNRSVPVVIVREPGDPQPSPTQASRPPNEPEVPATIPVHMLPKMVFPGLIWERSLLDHSIHLALPRVIQQFHADGMNYLIEEAPEGKALMEAWREPDVTYAQRFTWIRQIVEGIQRLHSMGSVVFGLSPKSIVITASGQAMLAHVDEFVPLPLPKSLKPAWGPYHAPEFRATDFTPDLRSDQFSLGATLLAVCLGRDLKEDDYVGLGLIRPFFDYFPDAPPLLGRLISKLTQLHPDQRFPSHDRKQSDPSGIEELLDTIDRCIRTLDRVSLDISGWTTTGAIRTGNEDAIAIVQGRESILEEMDDFALLILADGMGGMECGEIASSLAVHTIRESLLHEPPFGPGGNRKSATPNPQPRPATVPSGTEVQIPSVKPLPAATEMQIAAIKPDTTRAQPVVDPNSTEVQVAYKTGPTVDEANQGGKWLQQKLMDRESVGRDGSSHQRRLMQAIREANQKVFNAARSGFGHHGMGATMEVVLIDVNQAVIGHVGDSRVYHLRDGKMSLVTHDQTYVFREVAEGRMTPEQAESHPRRSELQQAVGGRVDIFPDFYTQELLPGDWLLVCSDGLSNTVKNSQIESILSKSASAAQAARRLVNRANQMNATDNVSVIVVHVL